MRNQVPSTQRRPAKQRLATAIGLGLVLLGSATGCQIDVGGQTLPSPYYLTDDVQYFAPGTEFKLSKEAARLKETSQEDAGDDR